MKTEKVLYLARGSRGKLKTICQPQHYPNIFDEVWRVTGSPAEEARRRVARVREGAKDLGVKQIWPKEEKE